MFSRDDMAATVACGAQGRLDQVAHQAQAVEAASWDAPGTRRLREERKTEKGGGGGREAWAEAQQRISAPRAGLAA